MLGEPYLIADVPSDLTGVHGNVFATDVYSFSTLERKKRSEVALAIDRQGINIYDVNNHSADLPARRYTYCCVKLPKPRILGFLEHCTQTSSLTAISTFSTDIENRSPVLYLDVIQRFSVASDSKQNHAVFAVHEDASISCFTAKLDGASSQSSQRLEPRLDGAKSLKLKYVIALSRKQAIKAILKNREDILATSTSKDGALDNNFLFAVTSASTPHSSYENRSYASLFELFEDSDSAPAASRLRLNLNEMISQAIPLPMQLVDDSSWFALHKSSASLYQTSGSGIRIYDFVSFAPRFLQVVPSTQSGIESSLRLSPSLLAVAATGKIDLVDLPFGALQARRILVEVGLSPTDPDRSQAGEPSLQQGSIRLLSYSPQTALVIAFHERKLLAIPTSIQNSSFVPRKRARNGLLIGSLGRGSAILSPGKKEVSRKSEFEQLGNIVSFPTSDSVWEQHKKSLNQLFREHKFLAFEDSLFPEFSSRPHPSIPSHKVDYLLSKIFNIDHDARQHNVKEEEAGLVLRIVMWPQKLCQSMMSRDLVNQDRVESSLKSTGTLPIESSLAHGTLLRAFAEWDTSLSILQTAISESLPLSPLELATTLALLIPVIQNNGTLEDTKLLTYGNTEASHDTGREVQILDDAKAFDRSSAYDRVEKAKDILYLVLQKIYSLPPHSSAAALRQVLGRQQLRSLADMLRLELASDGWLSFYDRYDNSKEQSAIDDHMTHVSHLINVILDALGPAGWMIGSASSDELAHAADTISHMKAEISAALEGIEEATYLQHALGEVLLCGKDTLLPRGQFQQKYALDSGMKKGAIRPSNPVFQGLLSNELPLGLRLRPKIPLTKIGAGGEIIKRSKRDLGRLKSRTVGKYSFEKINI
ncbi:uncharacterized protein KY384_004967 [Bacidia gigantensis]|uniref:uncharacterized protein n=1 Tax=Bacidia gigantensis TaxID=2732470 RepID=UPI001D04D2C7|nr:uncharacterized protein KY384_004967 [Bacidia gigantensis]KAG8530464.1 hypothetical protein KY384_004967 [Bacidia gigantensis]